MLHNSMFYVCSGTWNICILTNAKNWNSVHCLNFSPLSTETDEKAEDRDMDTTSLRYRRCWTPLWRHTWMARSAPCQQTGPWVYRLMVRNFILMIFEINDSNLQLSVTQFSLHNPSIVISKEYSYFQSIHKLSRPQVENWLIRFFCTCAK